MLIQGTRITLLLGSLFCVGLFVFADPFCALWVGGPLGNDYRIVARVIQLCAVVDFLACMASMQWPMMLGSRNLNKLMVIHGAMALINIVLSVYFVGFTRLGVPGAAAGTVLSCLLLRPVLIIYSTMVYQVRIGTFFKKALLTPFLVTALLLPAAYAIRTFMYQARQRQLKGQKPA